MKALDPYAEPAYLSDDQRAGLAIPVEPLPSTSFVGVTDPAAYTLRWLVTGLVPAAGVTLLAAHAKTGKTMLVYRLILDAITGKLALGSFPVPEPLRVQLWQFEMPLDINLRRFHKLALGMGLPGSAIYDAEQAENFQAFVQPDISLSDPGGLAAFHRAVSAFEPDLVVVDSVSEAFPGVNIDKSQEVRPALRAAFSPLTVAGRSTLLIHHKRKAPADGREGDGKASILGSQAFGAAARMIYTLDRVRDDGPEIAGRFVVGLAPVGGWDLETTDAAFVIQDDEAGTYTTIDPIQPGRSAPKGAPDSTTMIAVRVARLVTTRQLIGRQSLLAEIRGELRIGETKAKAGLSLAIERGWVAAGSVEGRKANKSEYRPGESADWTDDV